MKKQFHFRNQPQATKCPTYCKPSTWTLPEPNSTNLTLFLEQTQNLIPNPPTCHKTQSYLITKVHPKKLGSNQHLVIKPFNKGSGICLMDTSLYISKIEEPLADLSTYKELSSNPTQAIRHDVLLSLNYLCNTHQIDQVTRHHLTPPKPARTPLFYGLPKVINPTYHFSQQYQHVAALPINFRTINFRSPTSYNLLWRYSPP